MHSKYNGQITKIPLYMPMSIIYRCFHKCVNGYCIGAPDYTCKCDLGWTGPDCAINCGCNNHSTCNERAGKCDQCKDWTTGQFCEYCK